MVLGLPDNIIAALLVGALCLPKPAEDALPQTGSPTTYSRTVRHITEDGMVVHYFNQGPLTDRLKKSDTLALEGTGKIATGSNLEAALLLAEALEKLPKARITERRRAAYQTQYNKAHSNFSVFDKLAFRIKQLWTSLSSD